VTDSLAASYEFCRALHRAHGRTYYLATRLLPRWKRRHVHALYGFTRYTDDIVDRVDGEPPARRAARLRRWGQRFTAALDGAPVDDPVLPAVLDTISAFDLDRTDFAVFLRSMEMDLTVTEYATYDDLLGYMAGSAAAIGTMMLPILGSRDPVLAREPARQLGLAFQLTNFVRDVAEDLRRGRIYLPRKDLAEFGVTPEDLRAGVATDRVRELIAFEVARARGHYARAAAGIPLLEPASQACIRAAHLLYGGILDEVARAGFDVFRRRATVPHRRRLAVAVGSLLTPPGRPVPGGTAAAEGAVREFSGMPIGWFHRDRGKPSGARPAGRS
jgi:15-cis-phytoene synthase